MNRSTPGLPVFHQTGVSPNSCPSSRWCHPPISSSVIPSPPAPNPSQHQGLSNESTLRMRWPKYWSFSFSISPSKQHPGLISFRMDWLDLLAVQGTLKRLLQHHSSRASILQRSAFFTVQLSHPYIKSMLLLLLLLLSHFSRVWLLATPWTAAYQAPPSMGFSRQEYWVGCHCLLQ